MQSVKLKLNKLFILVEPQQYFVWERKFWKLNIYSDSNEIKTKNFELRDKVGYKVAIHNLKQF